MNRIIGGKPQQLKKVQFWFHESKGNSYLFFGWVGSELEVFRVHHRNGNKLDGIGTIQEAS